MLTPDFKEFIWGPQDVPLILLAAMLKSQLAAYIPKNLYHYPFPNVKPPSIEDVKMEYQTCMQAACVCEGMKGSSNKETMKRNSLMTG